MPTTRRLKILLRYLKNPARYTYISLSEVLREVVGPTSAMIASRAIERIDHQDGYLVCHLKGVARPLYWPELIEKRWLDQMISEVFYPKGAHYYEIPETRVRLGDVVVDCGAAEGLFSLMVIGQTRRCFCVEPLPIFQQALARTFADVPGVEVLPVALGSAPGELRMREATIMSAIDEGGKLRVRVETIDRLFFEHGIAVDFLKADLEGAEMDMLRGVVQTIRSC